VQKLWTRQYQERKDHSLPFALEPLLKIASLAYLGLPCVLATGILNWNIVSKILAKKMNFLTQTLKSSLNFMDVSATWRIWSREALAPICTSPNHGPGTLIKMRGQNTFQDYSPLPFPFLQSEIRMVGFWTDEARKVCWRSDRTLVPPCLLSLLLGWGDKRPRERGWIRHSSWGSLALTKATRTTTPQTKNFMNWMRKKFCSTCITRSLVHFSLLSASVWTS